MEQAINNSEIGIWGHVAEDWPVWSCSHGSGATWQSRGLLVAWPTVLPLCLAGPLSSSFFLVQWFQGYLPKCQILLVSQAIAAKA